LFFHLFLGRTVSRLLLAHTVCVQGTFRSTCSVSCISSLLILFVNVIPNTDFRKVTRIVAVFCSSCDINIPLPYIWLGETADCASSGVFLVSYFYQNVLCWSHLICYISVFFRNRLRIVSACCVHWLFTVRVVFDGSNRSQLLMRPIVRAPGQLLDHARGVRVLIVLARPRLQTTCNMLLASLRYAALFFRNSFLVRSQLAQTRPWWCAMQYPHGAM
jgi:hypothetical protein